ncbi:MAG TPA: hypothetical protein VMV69_09630 [Pirellulales bacterium]|nr:hypothetical protein [Pirellulales bacterium]
MVDHLAWMTPRPGALFDRLMHHERSHSSEDDAYRSKQSKRGSPSA